MADGARLPAPAVERQVGETSPPPAILPLLSAIVEIMVREERERQKAEAVEDAA